MNRSIVRQRIIIITSLCIIAGLVMSLSLAWFMSPAERFADTAAMKIEQPPILYILDSDAEDIQQLDLNGLEIGKEKKIVFCISSVYPISEDSHYHNSFSLELAYTKNLGANYNLYAAEYANSSTGDLYYSQAGKPLYFQTGLPLTGINKTAQGNSKAYGSGYESSVQSKNQSDYIVYSYDEDTSIGNSNMIFSTESTGNGDDYADTSKCRFFVLDITWENGISGVDAKETDMIYVIARGGSAQ